MSDEYIAQLIVGELTSMCPGDRACHGCLHWCPVCGDVANVCDDPRCDSHPREKDQLRKMGRIEKELARLAAETKKWEERLLAQTDNQTAGATPGGCREHIKRTCERMRATEADLAEEEERLEAVRRAGAKLVPRPEPRHENPGQAELPFR